MFRVSSKYFQFIYLYIQYIYFLSKVNIWNVYCARATAFGCSWESVNVFETENVSTWGGLWPPTFEFMPNALTYWAIRATHLLSHGVAYWRWRYRYFWSKVNIWIVYMYMFKCIYIIFTLQQPFFTDPYDTGSMKKDSLVQRTLV